MCLNNFYGYEELDILNNYVTFSNAVQKYKNIITYYHADKAEIWMILLIKAVHSVDSGILLFEFSVRRGNVHFHSHF